MELEHHSLELFEIDHPVTIAIEFFNELLPVFVRDLFVFVSQDVLELSWSDLAISIHIKKIKGLLKIIFRHQLIEIRSRSYKL